MPFPKPVNIALLIHERASLSIVFLLQDLFGRANLLGEASIFKLVFISYKKRFVRIHNLELSAVSVEKSTDILLIPPFQADFDFNLADLTQEIHLIREFSKRPKLIASACMGALLAAAAGVLNGQIATTHWRAKTFVSEHFPAVNWNLNEMICDTGLRLTSGGYLAAIDLALYLIQRFHSKRLAHHLGQMILANSIKQKQSIYAQSLVSPRQIGSTFYNLEHWIEHNLSRRFSVCDLAQQSGMSLRSFQRHFTSEFGISPVKYLQLKRIDRAKTLLKVHRLSLGEILEDIGLSDPVSFSRIFLRELGMTPAEFRKATKAGISSS